MAPASDAHLLRVTQAKADVFERWMEGVYLETSSGQPLPELQDQAVVDRLKLAERFAAAARSQLRSRPPRYRDAISRYYYAMYHGMRAVALFHYKGDDHQEHSALPGRTPPDFPDAARWQNALKSAKQMRNSADYDPYPAAEAAWRSQALQIQADSVELVRVIRGYLLTKGCRFI